MTDIMLVGDVGGCLRELERAVRGWDGVVIQVGDLVDRGPDSEGVVEFVRERLEDRRWIQLLGNHEAQYLAGQPRFWPESVSDSVIASLRGWWDREKLRIAAAVRDQDGEEFLVTHAGLTVGSWHALDDPVTAGTTADLLNTRIDEVLWGNDGPLWAEAGPDVYDSWLALHEPVPFSQIHGHSTIVSFPRESWMADERIRDRAEVDWQARHTTTRIHGARFIGIDPKHGRTGAPTWEPLILRNATVIAGG